MAKVYLDSGDTFSLSGAASVYGSTGTEKLIINSGVTGVVVDQNVERVDLAGASSTYTFQQSGNQLKVFSGTTLVATVPVQDDADGTQLVFSNGSVSVKVAATGMTLGGATVPSAAAAAVTPTTIDATVTSGSGTSTGTTTGQTFSLTTTVETKALTSGNDTVDGSTVANSLSGDTLVDASTTDSDVLNAVITATPTKPVISNVETMNIDFKGFNLSLDASAITGGNIVASTTQEYNTGATITGLSNKGVGVNVGSGITTLTIGGSTEATDAANVKLAGGNLTLTTNSTNAIETVGLNSTGSAANVVTLTSATSAETFNVTGDKSLTLKVAQANVTGDTVTKALTGGSTLTVELTTAAAALDLKKVAADTFTTAATGNIAIGANLVTFAAGTTNLEVNDAGVLTNVGSVLTADGTATTDVLNLKLNKVGAATNALASSGFETVNITNGTTGDVTLTNAAHTFGTSGAAKLLGSGNFSFGTTAIVAKSVDASAMTGTGTLTVSVADNTAAAISVTGTANNDTITVAQTTKTATINAGNGSNTVTAATATFGVSITTGTGNDTITSGTGNDTITAGAGNDTITATTGAGNHVILGGEGDDSINVSAGTGNIFVNAGTGNDLVNVGANLTLNDTIVGGDGTDTLVVTNDTATSDLDNVSGFETITLTNTGTSAYTTKDSLVASGNKLTVTQSGNFALTWNGAAETDGTFEITLNGTAAHVITGGAGADVINAVGGGDVTVTGGKGADVITITGTGTSVVVQAKGDSLAVTSLSDGMSLAGADVVKNGATGIVTTGDKFNFGNTAITGNGTSLSFSNTFTGVTLANDKIYQVRGDYNTTTKTFVSGVGGADSLFVYDADATSATQFETIVLTGYVGNNATADFSGVGAAGILTLA